MTTDKNYDNYLIVHSEIQGLQYDLNAILKAFFPERKVRVIEDGVPVRDQVLLSLKPYMTVCGRVDGAESADALQSPLMKGRVIVEGRAREYDVDPELGTKNSFKLFLYDLMCELTGRTLPWGNLTGVRPTKIAMTRMRMGDSDDEVLGYMQGRHRVSEEKSRLALDIAHREADMMSGLDLDAGYSLYVDVPFCPTRCLYCSFTSYPYEAWKDRIDESLNALFKEIDYVADEVVQSSGRAPETVYVGGGTPTSLDDERLERLLKHLTDRIDVKSSLEFTCEAGRPDSITREKLEIIRRYGVTRISINPQTMQQKTLDVIGRRTTPGQVREAFALARELGFDNVNMDVILGLPGEGTDEVSDTLRQTEEMRPDSLTVHSLAIKRASRLRERLDEIGIEALRNTDETMSLAAASAAAMGMKPYYLYRQKNMSGNFENVGYSVPGKECTYNVLIMEEVQSIVALGAGAISKKVRGSDGITRAENPKDIDNYVYRIDEMIERKRELFG